MIQQHAYGFAAWPRGGKQHERDLPVVELRTIRLSVLSVNGSFEATRTVLQVAGVALMAIERGNADPVMVRQRLVSFQPVIDVMNPAPQALGIHQSCHAFGTQIWRALPAWL